MSEAAPLTHLEARVLAAIERHVRAEGVAPTIAELATDLRLKSKGTVHRYVQSLIAKGRLERHGNGWRGLRIVGLPMPGRPSNVHRLPLRRRDDVSPPVELRPGSTLPERGDDAARSMDRSCSPARIAPSGARALPSGNVDTPMMLSPPSGGGDATPGDPAEPADSVDPRIPLLGRIAAGLPIEAIEDQRFLDLSGLFAGPERYALRVSGDSMMDAGILDGDTVILRKQQTARPGDIVVALIDGQEATLKRLGGERDGLVELVPENATMEPLRYAASRVSFQGVLIGQLRHY